MYQKKVAVEGTRYMNGDAVIFVGAEKKTDKGTC